MKKLFEITFNNNEKIKILGRHYKSHISLTKIKIEDDINCVFGQCVLVSNKPSTIEKELNYYINECFKYSHKKVESYKLIDSQESI